MTKVKKIGVTTFAAVASLSMVLAGCGSTTSSPKATETTTSTTKAVSDAQPVTLKMLHFMEAEAGPTLKDINKRFHENIRILRLNMKTHPLISIKH